MLALGASGTLQASATSAATVDVTVGGLLMNAAIPPVAQDYEVLSSVGQQLSNSAGTIVTMTAGQSCLISSIHLYNTNAGAAQNVAIYINGSAGSNQIAGFQLPPGGWATYEDGTAWTVYNAQGLALS